MNSERTYTMTSRAEGTAATSDRILRSAMALLLELPFEEVTLAAIGKAAGVSHQTVLNHFQSKEGVVIGVARMLGEETMANRRPPEPGDIVGAISALVGEYERIGDANFRWSAAAERSDQLADLMAKARTHHQRWLAEVFYDRLPAGVGARTRALHALHAATDVYVWKLLRRDLGLSRRATREAMCSLVAGALQADDPASES